jgi:hypothetical protein
MSARTGLTDLLLRVRAMCDAGTADYTQTGGTAVYWDDDQLQLVLDRHRQEVTFAPLEAIPQRVGGGTVEYREYRSEYANFEKTTAGTSIFIVEDGLGANASTADYTPDYARGVVTFTNNQDGTAYYVTGRSYDLNAAAADIWRTKAAQAAKRFDFSTDNHSVSRSQLYKHALEMAAYYEGQQSVRVTTLFRSDNG